MKFVFVYYKRVLVSLLSYPERRNFPEKRRKTEKRKNNIEILNNTRYFISNYKNINENHYRIPKSIKIIMKCMKIE